LVFQLVLPSVVAPRYPGSGPSNIPDRLAWYRDIAAQQLGLMGPYDEVPTILGSSRLALVLLGVIVALALAEPYQRRICRIFFGVSSVSDVVEVFSGYMNTMTIEDSGETSNISLTVESKLIELNRARVRRYTHESHQARHPDDTFFSFVADLQDKSVVWGRKEA
jgi:hypothetical protein